jgi:hypothetical protein
LNALEESFSGSSELLLSSDTIHDEAEVGPSFNGFSFEWDNVQEDNVGLADELDISTFDHEPTLLNAIEEVPEGEDSRIITPGLSPIDIPASNSQGSATWSRTTQSTYRTFWTFLPGLGKIWSRCKRVYVVSKRGTKSGLSEQTPNHFSSATCQASDRPSRNRLRRRTPPLVTDSLPVDPASSQPFASQGSKMNDVTTTHSLCSSGGIFSGSKYSWKGHFARVDRGKLLRTQARRSQDPQQSTVDTIPDLFGDTSMLPWGGSDLRLCRHRHIYGATL